MYLPDDATEEELAELAADQREHAARQRERATTSTQWPVAHAIFRRLNNELPDLADLDLYNSYGSDIAELNN